MRLPLEPVPKGITLAVISVSGVAIGLSFFLASIPAASPELLRTLGIIGASFVLAYAIEAAWIVSQGEVTEDHEEWLGFLVGVGIAGLIAIGMALLLAEHRLAGHDNYLDALGLGWVLGALSILGGVIVLQPLLADVYRDA